MYEPYASFLTFCAYLLQGCRCLYSLSFREQTFSETHGSKVPSVRPYAGVYGGVYGPYTPPYRGVW